MKFEDEIKQSAFKDPYEKVTLNVIYTGHWLRDKTEAILKAHHINDQHYNILRILRGSFPKVLCPGDVKAVLINKRGDLTRLLDKLVNMNLVKREANAENRRMVNLLISDEGLQLLTKLDPYFLEFRKLEDNLTAKEATQLSDLLDKLRG